MLDMRENLLYPDVGKTLGFGVYGQERIRDSFAAKKVILLKQGDRTRGQKERQWGHEEWPIKYFQAGRGLGIG